MKNDPAPRADRTPEPPGVPPESMMPLWRRIHGEFVRRSQTWPLPPGASFILLGLHHHPELAEPSVIAKTHYLPRQTTTFILDSLERKKLAVRRPHPSDRRRKLVHITAKGRLLAAALLRDLLQFEARALKELNARNLTAAQRLLTRYADALARANRGGESP